MSPPTVIGRYQILQSVGSGGMGSIYLARDPKIGNRRVVIKLLREGFDNPELRERFAREADAAGALHHVNVVTIFDVGDFEGQPFIAMEYIQGETLTDLIHKDTKLPVSRKLQLMEELCAGLHYAHRAGVVHRDIKPANVMVDEDGVLKILDFGIARLGGGGMTQAGMVMGTLNYMAPEQMAGKPVDHRADIFAAGAVFYELLSYRRAFPGELPSIVHRIMTASREPLGSLVPDLDPVIVAIVDRCLAREPGDRYPDIAAVRREIASVRQRTIAAEQKELHGKLEEARDAVKRSDFSAALDACERMLVLESDYGPAIELQLQARAALQHQQVAELLSEARTNLDRGALTAASLLVDRVDSVASESPEAQAMREAIEAERRRMAEAQARRAALADALARAHAEFDAGTYDAARATLDDILRQDPEYPDAIALKGRVTAAEAAKKKEAEARARAAEEARAQAAIDQARRRFASGDYADALTMLETFQPAHPIVTAALRELHAEARELERRRIEAERQRKEEEERREQARRREEEERRKAAEAAERKRVEDERHAREQAQKKQEEDERRKAAEAAKPAVDLSQLRPDMTIRVDAKSAQAAALKGLPEKLKGVPDKTIVIPPKPAGKSPRPDETQRLAVSPISGAQPAVARPSASKATGSHAPAARPSVPAPAPIPASRPSFDPATLLKDPAALLKQPIALAAGAVVLLLVIVAGWRAMAPATPPAPPVAATTVVLNVSPWAKIDAITRKSDGQAMPVGNLVTPCIVALPPGEYHIRASNPSFSPLEFDLTIKAGAPTNARFQMPGFDPQTEAASIVER